MWYDSLSLPTWRLKLPLKAGMFDIPTALKQDGRARVQDGQ